MRQYFAGSVIRGLIALTLVVCSAFALLQWFLLGVFASKWIGLDSMAPAMARYQYWSVVWGYGGIAFQLLAVWILPMKFGMGSGAAQDRRSLLATLKQFSLRLLVTMAVTLILAAVVAFSGITIRPMLPD